MNKIKVSDLGIVKFIATNRYGNEYTDNEIKLDTFFKELEDNVHKKYKSIEYNNCYEYIDFSGSVKKGNNKDEYIIDYNNSKWSLQNDKGPYYDIVKNKMDSLVSITEFKENEQEIIKSFEEGNVNNNKNNIKSYLDFLNYRQKELTSSKKSNLIFCFLPLFLALGIGIVALTMIFNFSSLITLLNVIIGVAFMFIGVGTMIILPDSIDEFIKAKKEISINEEKLKSITNIYEKAKEMGINLNNTPDLTPNIANYKSAVYSYMHTIALSTKTMNQSDMQKIISELQAIEKEYTDKMIEFNKTKQTGLNFDNKAKEQIIQETLEKLIDLTMLVGEIRKQDEKNSKVLSDSELFKNEIDSIINSNSEEQEQGQTLELSLH